MFLEGCCRRQKKRRDAKSAFAEECRWGLEAAIKAGISVGRREFNDELYDFAAAIKAGISVGRRGKKTQNARFGGFKERSNRAFYVARRLNGG
ncbi:MAG: hypothetical protein IJ991_12070 [Thermoguttaceae bacterium]|nr:hypothetical protein [Thermoguttaceae bacterium]